MEYENWWRDNNKKDLLIIIYSIVIQTPYSTSHYYHVISLFRIFFYDLRTCSHTHWAIILLVFVSHLEVQITFFQYKEIHSYDWIELHSSISSSIYHLMHFPSLFPFSHSPQHPFNHCWRCWKRHLAFTCCYYIVAPLVFSFEMWLKSVD